VETWTIKAAVEVDVTWIHIAGGFDVWILISAERTFDLYYASIERFTGEACDATYVCVISCNVVWIATRRSRRVEALEECLCCGSDRLLIPRIYGRLHSIESAGIQSTEWCSSVACSIGRIAGGVRGGSDIAIAKELTGSVGLIRSDRRQRHWRIAQCVRDTFASPCEDDRCPDGVLGIILRKSQRCESSGRSEDSGEMQHLVEIFFTQDASHSYNTVL
jgi:hypothetical protein